jgi:hypothetical protein
MSVESEKTRLKDFFTARFNDCENSGQQYNVRRQFLESLAKLYTGMVTAAVIEEVDDHLRHHGIDVSNR